MVCRVVLRAGVTRVGQEHQQIPVHHPPCVFVAGLVLWLEDLVCKRVAVSKMCDGRRWVAKPTVSPCAALENAWALFVTALHFSSFRLLPHQRPCCTAKNKSICQVPSSGCLCLCGWLWGNTSSPPHHHTLPHLYLYCFQDCEKQISSRCEEGSNFVVFTREFIKERVKLEQSYAKELQ